MNTILPSTFSESRTIYLCMRCLISSFDLLMQVLMQPRGLWASAGEIEELAAEKAKHHGDTRLGDDDDGRGDL